ncbi:MAG: sigma-70 family RNA polymerase sigma factor [Christensenellales bacterium]|jgi:RNA polymerase sigma-B factor
MSKEKRDALFAAHTQIAQIAARRFAGRGVEYDDLLQVASLALLKAAERFDPQMGYLFSTFATPTVVGEVKNWLRDNAKPIRVPRRSREMLIKLRKAEAKLSQQFMRSPTVPEIAREMGVSEDLVLEAMEADGASSVSGADDSDALSNIPTDEGGFAELETKDMLQSAMRLLNNTERRLIELRFHESLSQRETAQKIGISQMSVSRMEKRVIEKMRRALQED